MDSPALPPDEIAIRIDDVGQVFLNEDPLDSPELKSLPELTRNLQDLRASSEAAKSDLAVTIYSDESARYGRIVDTLDALSRAEISKVTFQSGEP